MNYRNLEIRSEIDTDASAITEVTVAAFETLEISDHTEQSTSGWASARH